MKGREGGVGEGGKEGGRGREAGWEECREEGRGREGDRGGRKREEGWREEGWEGGS